jgi:hypothetical protein
MRSHDRLSICIGVASLCAAGFWANAGPLAPPPGPVTETSPSLASLENSINALATAGAPADTSATPGDASDGRPLMLSTGQSGLIYRLEIAGYGVADWSVAELGESIEVNEHPVINSNGQEFITPIPGRVRTQRLLLVRDLTADSTIDTWWNLVKDGSLGAAQTTASLIVLDSQLNEIARWNFYDCWPAALDHRAIDGRMSEQLLIVAKFSERVFN